MPSSAGPPEQPTGAEKFYGLLARPFSLTPDLRFAYHSRSHTRALEQVTEALRRREGLIVVTGEIGTGKTMLCRTLLETFEARTFLSVVLDPCLTVEDLLRQVLADFGLVTDAGRATGPLTEVTRHQLVTTLQRFLASLISIDAHAVIMIDEAQHLNPGVLEEIRLLSNFETDNAKLLQIVLVGQPDLDELLRRPDMRQLDQRIARRYELQPLSNGEVQDYIDRRLFVAADAVPVYERKGKDSADSSERRPLVEFTPEAVEAIAAISRGIPRVVNTLCDRALDVGFEQQTRIIDRAGVLAAAERLQLPMPALMKGRRGRSLGAAAAVLLVAVGLGAWWWSSRPQIPAAGPSRSQAPIVPSREPASTLPATSDPARSARPPGPPAAPAPSTIDLPERSAATAGSSAPGSGAAAAAARAGGRYNINVASFKTPQRAARVAASLAAMGLPVATRPDSTGEWFGVVVGPYASMGEAEAARVILTREGFPDTRVTPRAPEER